MPKNLFISAGVFSIIAIASFALYSRSQKTSPSTVEQEITHQVKLFDNALYGSLDRKTAKHAANEIIRLAARTTNPNETKARGIIRLAYANIATGHWDNQWKNRVEECEALIPAEPSVARAELLLYSGKLIGKWGKHNFEAGLRKVQRARAIANHVDDDRTLALTYVASTELQMFLGRSDMVAMHAYHGYSVANHHGEQSLKIVALRGLLSNMIYLHQLAEAGEVAKLLEEISPGSPDAKYVMFVTGESTEFRDHVLNAVQKLQAETQQPTGDTTIRQACLGNMLSRLARAYIMRNEPTEARKILVLAIPHLEAVHNTISLNACNNYLQITELALGDDIAVVDKIAANPSNVFPFEQFALFVAAAYNRLGDKEKSNIWMARVLNASAETQTNEISFLKHSSEKFWDMECNLREADHRNREIANAAQVRVWYLSTALALGLTVCTLLGGCYYLLRRKSNSLEDIVKLRTGSLYNAMQKANAADQAKSDFLAQINHEIRNPLTAILGYCELLMMSNKTQNDFVSGIQASSLHLRELVDKILEVSKIETNGLEPQLVEFFPAQTTQDIYGIMTEQTTKRGLRFECVFKGDRNTLISSDETKIRQIALNLLGNACKFTEYGSITATFELRKLDMPSKAELVIDVNDTGIGIEKSQIDEVFGRFTKATNASTLDGSGLGLFITKRLVECLGGKITLSSSLGIGTRVRATLPVATIDSCPPPTDGNFAGAADEQDDSKALSAKRVLVVDDQPMIRHTLQLQLKSQGLLCETTDNLERAISLVKSWQPDLVLLDLRMPKSSGFDVLKEIRNSPNSNVPVYAITGDATVSSQQKCYSAGFDGFITKPFKIKLVVEALESEASTASSL